MAISPPSKLAQLLKLSESGCAAQIPSTYSKEEQMKAGVAVQTHFENLKAALFDPGSYNTEFCSQYLPSLICTYLAAKGSLAANVYRYTLDLVLGHGIESPFLHRFVRTFPDEATNFFRAYAVSIEDALEDAFNPTINDPELNEAGRDILVCFFDLTISISEHLPCTLPFPSLESSSIQVLRAFASRCKDDADVQTLFKQQGLPLDDLISLINAVSDSGSARQCLKDSLPFRATSWMVCELQVAPHEAADASPCATLDDGEEMMACSRCLAVRYCCKEHQKADWKRHKKFCFKPTW